MYRSTASDTVMEGGSALSPSLNRSRVFLAHWSAWDRVLSCFLCRCPRYLTVASQPFFFRSKLGMGHYRATARSMWNYLYRYFKHLYIIHSPLAGERLRPLGHLSNWYIFDLFRYRLTCSYLTLLYFDLFGPLEGHQKYKVRGNQIGHIKGHECLCASHNAKRDLMRPVGRFLLRRSLGFSTFSSLSGGGLRK